MLLVNLDYIYPISAINGEILALNPDSKIYPRAVEQ